MKLLKCFLPAFMILFGGRSLHGLGLVYYDSLQSTTLGRTVKTAVWVPNAYRLDSLVRYPVMYALHGQGIGNYTTWTDMISLFAAMNQHPTIIAMFDNGYNLYAGETDFFFTEWIPWMDNTYRTVNQPGARAVSGFSSGGFGSFHYMLAHPDSFASVAVMSAAFQTVVPYRTVDSIRAALDNSVDLPPMYICIGTSDFLLNENREMRDSLEAWQANYEYHEGAGDHNWDFWKDWADDLLLFHWQHFAFDTTGIREPKTEGRGPRTERQLGMYSRPMKERGNFTGLGSPVDIKIYNHQGKLVTVVSGNTWNGEDAAGNRVGPGIYFYTVRTVMGKIVKIE